MTIAVLADAMSEARWGSFVLLIVAVRLLV
jgi:hypothetical protein